MPFRVAIFFHVLFHRPQTASHRRTTPCSLEGASSPPVTLCTAAPPWWSSPPARESTASCSTQWDGVKIQSFYLIIYLCFVALHPFLQIISPCVALHRDILTIGHFLCRQSASSSWWTEMWRLRKGEKSTVWTRDMHSTFTRTWQSTSKRRNTQR